MSLLSYWMGLKSSHCFFKMPTYRGKFWSRSVCKLSCSTAGYFLFLHVQHLVCIQVCGSSADLCRVWPRESSVPLQDKLYYTMRMESVPWIPYINPQHMFTTQKGQPHLLCQRPLQVMTENEYANNFRDHREVSWWWRSQSGAELWKYKSRIKDINFFKSQNRGNFSKFL